MNRGSSLGKFLNFKLTVNPDKRVSVKFVLIFVSLTAIIITAAGFWVVRNLSSSAQNSYYDNHIRELQEILRDYPEDRVVAMELAMTLYLNGDVKKAVALAKKYYEKYPDDRNVLLNLGLILSDRGDYGEAVVLLEKLNRRYPGFEAGKVALNLGKNFSELGEYRKARTYLEQAVIIEPGSPPAYYYLGRARERLGDNVNAAAAYRQAILLAGTYPEAEKALKGITGK